MSLASITLATCLITLATPSPQSHTRAAAAGIGCSADARTPISSVPGNSGWRHVITAPGSYYLDKNVAGAANTGAIRVDVAGVTIDFNGFTLIGGDPLALSAVSSSFDDVRLLGPGLLRDWSSGVFLSGARCSVADLTILDTLTNGVQMLGPDGVVERCVVQDNEWEGIHLGPDADGVSVVGCKLRDNLRRQVFVEADGCRIEGCTVTAGDAVTQSPVEVTGAGNVLRDNTVTCDGVGQKALDVSGDGNRLLDNVVRLTSAATFAEGIAVTGALNEVRGGHVTVEPNLATGIRFDQPLNIIAVLIGLRASADDATGIRANAAGYIEGNDVHVASVDSFGIDVQGGAANVGATLYENRIRVAGAGSTAVRSLASASNVQMNGIVLEASAANTLTIDVGGGPGGHHIAFNRMTLAGAGQRPVLNGIGDLIRENDVLVLGDGSTALSKVSGTGGLIADNRVRLAGPNATGIFVSEFSGDVLWRNVVVGDGTRLDVGEGNTSAQVVSNPGNGFTAEGIVNYEIGN